MPDQPPASGQGDLGRSQQTQFQRQYPDYPPDQMVILSDGRTMRYGDFLSEQRAIQERQMAAVSEQLVNYTRQMSATVEELWAVAGQMYAGSAEVRSALDQVRAGLAGLDDQLVCGTNDVGIQIQTQLRQVWPAVQRVIENICPNLEAFGAGLQAGADTLRNAEESTLRGFSESGFNVPVAGPSGPGVY
jgi:hypothetical protein